MVRDSRTEKTRNSIRKLERFEELRAEVSKIKLVRPAACAIKSDFSPRSKEHDCWELTDPVDVGHPALFRVSCFPMPNNEESDENPDQRRCQEELAHKTALLCFIQRVRDAPRVNVQL